MTTVPESVGPFGWENWRAYSGGDPAAAFEYACYTDAYVTGEVLDGLGPYQLLNTVAIGHRPGDARLAVVLRVGYHADPYKPDPERLQTNVGGYHGGDVSDEIASLISLSLDRRMKAAGAVRSFLPGEDPLGHPRQLEHRQPYLALPTGRSILPRMTDTVLLDDCVPLLQRYPKFSAEQAYALVRAARAYQQALWIAEDDPALAWLKLISAVETAAWYRGPRGMAKKKFADFLVDFPVTPPTPRPVQGQLDWSPRALKRSFETIYDWRNKDLHNGIPIPLPMCEAPQQSPEGFNEVPFGLATWSWSTTWAAADTPMLLHTFKHIVGQALRAWWQTMP
jgi:hypothetical protein